MKEFCPHIEIRIVIRADNKYKKNERICINFQTKRHLRLQTIT